MLRLLRQPGVRVTTRSIAQQRIQFRGFINGSGDGEDFESGDKQEPEASGNTRPKAKQNWAPGDNDRLWDHVNKLDDRVTGLSKDLGDFKGDVHKSIGELARTMEKGFGDIKADMHSMKADINSKFGELDTKIESVKSDFKLTKWQVYLVFGGASAVIIWLVKDYMEVQFSRLGMVPEVIPDQGADQNPGPGK